MTPRSFWIIIVRTMGIYLIFEFLRLLIPFITQTLYMFGQHDEHMSYMEPVLGLIIVGGLYFLIFRYSIIHTGLVVDKLRLDKGFSEERFEFNLHRSTVLKIIIIVVGALMFLDSLPTLGHEILNYYRMSLITATFKDNPAAGWIIYGLIKLLAGFFMMTSSRLIVNFIERKRRGTIVAKEQGN